MTVALKTNRWYQLGAVALVIAVAAGAFMLIGNASNPGGITFSPANVSCSNPTSFNVTFHLPSSVRAGDTFNFVFDGSMRGTEMVDPSGKWRQQADGSWIGSWYDYPAGAVQSICARGGMDVNLPLFTSGSHTMQLTYANGKAVAQGSYTVSR